MQPSSPPSHQAHFHQHSLEHWLLLAHVPGMYSRVFNRLLDRFQESPTAILAAGIPALVESGISEPLAKEIGEAGKGRLDDACKKRIDACLHSHEQGEYQILARQAVDYPALLREIVDPPPILYVKGSTQSLHLPMVAMVGSRNPSADGRRHAFRFARQFAEGGIGVISGLARGIDTECHRGAMEGRGQTIAVLGCGIDRIYPNSNKVLASQIQGQGALITEFNPGTPPLAGHFPRRNRIISGLSLGVVVVEAGLKSGTLITARCALEQGREVYAIPGSINNPMARGCHSLIRQGACLVENPGDVVEDNGALLEHFQRQSEALSSPPQKTIDRRTLSSSARKLFDQIGYDPVPAEQLIQETGIDVATVTAALVDLEIQGLVAKNAGGYFRQPGN